MISENQIEKENKEAELLYKWLLPTAENGLSSRFSCCFAVGLSIAETLLHHNLLFLILQPKEKPQRMTGALRMKQEFQKIATSFTYSEWIEMTLKQGLSKSTGKRYL